MFEERLPPESYPCFLALKGERIKIASKEHYDYLNNVADKLYQEIHGYKSQPDLDYFCSSHPQESNCFVVALIMDEWCAEHDFNN
jgi:hypothetical protein